MTLRTKIARWLAPEEFEAFDMRVNNRVADVLFKLDPFEPLLKKYNVIFSEEWSRPEEKLDEQSQIRLFMWAYGLKHEPSFKHLTAYLMNTQGNATLRKARNSDEWFYGRAAVATIALFIEEINRLSSLYEEYLANRDKGFDPHLITE